MNGHAKDLREAFLHAIFERDSDVVNVGDGQAAVHGAAAGDENFVVHAVNQDFAAIHELVVFGLQ